MDVLSFPNLLKKDLKLKEIKGIGAGTIKRIDEILKTGTLSELPESLNDQAENKAKILEDLQRITGIGPVKAKKLYEYNITLSKILDTYKEDPKDELFEIFNNVKDESWVKLTGSVIILCLSIAKYDNSVS